MVCTKKDIDELKKDGKLEKELIVDIHSNESILEKFLNEMKNVVTWSCDDQYRE